MAIAPIERSTWPPSPVDSACAVLTDCARDVSRQERFLSGQEALQVIVDIERASRIVDHLQVLAARLAEEHYAVAGSTPSVTASAGTGAASSGTGGTVSSGWSEGGFRDCADFLRATLGISRTEARRRLKLAEVLLPRMSPTGSALPPLLETLGAATGACCISSHAATIVSQALHRVESFATSQLIASMEDHLTRQAMESDEDILRVLARRWESVLDQDGQEPSDKVLRARQGVFLKGRRHGLHILEIGATDEQFEHLATVMNSTAGPRGRASRADAAVSGTHPAGDDAAAGGIIDFRGGTRPQRLLDCLVAACRIALASAALPSTGGHRPQVMVTIDHKDLIGQTQRAGSAVFSELASARTIRRLACDADIIPVVLGGAGQVLDVGRARRLFPPHLRRALVARDRGCAFPDCSIPASWCEAHHMKPWSRGGSTSVANGVLLCSRHHHVIHQGTWTVEPRRGIPWFRAPGSPGRGGTTRKNRYWQAGQEVHEELLHDRP